MSEYERRERDRLNVRVIDVQTRLFVKMGYETTELRVVTTNDGKKEVVPASMVRK